jgi:hypothetical protein
VTILRKKKEYLVDRLSSQLKNLSDAQYDDPKWSCTRVEQRFAEAAISKGKTITRNGWPDFLVREGGKTYGVEVKSAHDYVRTCQRAMFEMLELAGIKVYVWTPTHPLVLIPWRKFSAARIQRTKDRLVRVRGLATVERLPPKQYPAWGPMSR